MKVILKQNVPNKGGRHDIINVSSGYAQNFLIANGQAVVATPANLKILKREIANENQQASQRKAELLALCKKIENIELEFYLIINQGKASNSISHKQIINQLENKHQIKIDKRKIVDHTLINKPGAYDLVIKFTSDISTMLKVTVLSKGK